MVRRLLLVVSVLCFVAAGVLWWRQVCGGRFSCRGPEPLPPPVVVPAAELAKTLPSDPAVRLGTLPNGFRYYLRPNGQPEHRLELRLVVNAGSVLEEDDQRGLAHFVEHMAFNGTTHFPKQAMAAFFASIGMRFGPSVNAQTSYDETIYSLQIPTDSPDTIERALLILEDWAHGVTFDPVEVDKERGVIVEEWRMRRGAAARLQAAQFPILLKDSRYADRLPIGDMDVIQHFAIDRLKQFYTDWYRPDLMALVAVGDLDPDSFESRLKPHFSRLAAPAAPRPRPTFEVPAQRGTAIGVASDQEAQGVTVGVYHKAAARPEVTVGDYRRSILGRLVAAMIGARLAEAAQTPGSALVGAGANESLIVRPLNATMVNAFVRPDAVDQGLLSLFGEYQRIARFGLTVPEFQRQKTVLLRNTERAQAEADSRPSAQLAAEYGRNFTMAEPFPGLAAEVDYTRQFLPSFSLDEVNALARQWIPDDNRVVLVTAPATAGQAIPTVERVASAIRGAQQMALQPYVPRTTAANLIDRAPTPGRVTKTTSPAPGVTEWTLSNGARVVLKPTTFKEDEILVGAFAPGGTSLVPETEIVPAMTAAQVVSSVGVGRFASGDLLRMLAGRAVALKPVVGTYEVGLTGGASQEDLETLLQLIYLHMAEPRRDPTTFEALVTQLRASLANQAATPDFAFGAALSDALAQGHPRAQPVTADRVSQMNLDASLAFYKARFANASNFTFVFVGSVTAETLKPLVEKYIASLPAGAPETWKDIGLTAPAGVVERRVDRGLDPKGRTALVFTADVPVVDDPTTIVLRATADILQERLRNALREELSGTYVVAVEAQLGSLPRPQSRISVAFGSDPARADALVRRVFTEVAKLRQEPVTAAELANERAALTRDYETNTRQNAYWIGQLAQRYEFNLPLDGITTIPGLIQNLSPAAIKAMADTAIDPARYVRVTLAPQKR